MDLIENEVCDRAINNNIDETATTTNRGCNLWWQSVPSWNYRVQGTAT